MPPTPPVGVGGVGGTPVIVNVPLSVVLVIGRPVTFASVLTSRLSGLVSPALPTAYKVTLAKVKVPFIPVAVNQVMLVTPVTLSMVDKNVPPRFPSATLVTWTTLGV